RTRDALDPPLELALDVQADAERRGDELDRPVVVRRAEPARGEHRVAVGERRPQHPLELLRRVADDVDAHDLEPESLRLACEKRAVQIGSIAAHELAARDDDDRARPRQEPARAVFVGVTTTFRLRRAGSEIGFPASLKRTPTGCRTESQNCLPSRNSASPARSVPW